MDKPGKSLVAVQDHDHLMWYWESPDELPMGSDDDWGQRANRRDHLIGVIKKGPQRLFSNTKRDFLEDIIVLRDDTDVKEKLDQILLHHVVSSQARLWLGWKSSVHLAFPCIWFGGEEILIGILGNSVKWSNIYRETQKETLSGLWHFGN